MGIIKIKYIFVSVSILIVSGCKDNSIKVEKKQEIRRLRTAIDSLPKSDSGKRTLHYYINDQKYIIDIEEKTPGDVIYYYQKKQYRYLNNLVRNMKTDC